MKQNTSRGRMQFVDNVLETQDQTVHEQYSCSNQRNQTKY